MLTCLPQSLCTWNFRVLGATAGPAALTFNFFTEQGGISLGQTEFVVRKHGLLSGRWTLELDGKPVVEAHKPSALYRSFELSAGEAHLTAKAHSAFTRRFDLIAGGKMVGTIRPVHAFTKRALIECASEIPELAQLFAFWLAVITWRRAANRNNGAG